jgi:uncharacterized membrane protein
MAQVVPISEDTDPQLLGLARSMAADMEAGRRPFKKSIMLDSGFIIFQKIGEKVRALVSTSFSVVGYGRKLVDGNLGEFHALTWSGNTYQSLPDDNIGSLANACTRDGKVIVGQVGTQAAIWEKRVYSALPSMSIASIAYGVSDDGKAVAGWFNYGSAGGASQYSNPARACRWDDKVITLLPSPSVTLPYTQVGQFDAATAISADGSTVVGWSQIAYILFTGIQAINVAVAWRDGEAIVLPSIIPDDPNFDTRSSAAAVSADGRKIAGINYNVGPFLQHGGDIAFLPVLWTDGVPQQLESEWSATVSAISRDGNVVVGGANVDNSYLVACKWVDGKQSFLPMNDSLRSTAATGVSSNGKIITGYGETVEDGSLVALKWVDGALTELNSDLAESVAHGVSG